MTLIDAYCSLPGYADHLFPVLEALPDDRRGHLYVPDNLRRNFEGREGVRFASPPRSDAPLIVAGAQDLTTAHRPKVLAQHGAGQRYIGVSHPSYVGGNGHELARLFLCPNEKSAAIERARYGGATVRAVAVGCPKLDRWRKIPAPSNDQPVIGVAFHWPCHLRTDDGDDVPESGTAFDTWREHLAPLAERYRLLGHGHPRFHGLREFWRSIGVEPVSRATDLLGRADILVADNTSLLYEFAACDRPVVAIDDVSWRENVNHGLRFWDQIPGIRVRAREGLDGLCWAIDTSLEPDPELASRRRDVTRHVYGHATSGMADAAAKAVLELADGVA